MLCDLASDTEHSNPYGQIYCFSIRERIGENSNKFQKSYWNSWDCRSIRFYSCDRARWHRARFAFVDRKGHTVINIHAVCDFNYKFIHFYSKWRGSSHDSFILQESKLLNDFDSGRRNGIILGDSGYGNRKKWLLTPFTTTENQKEKQYNYNQRKAKLKIEQDFAQFKCRFRGLLSRRAAGVTRESYSHCFGRFHPSQHCERQTNRTLITLIPISEENGYPLSMKDMKKQFTSREAKQFRDYIVRNYV